LNPKETGMTPLFCELAGCATMDALGELQHEAGSGAPAGRLRGTLPRVVLASQSPRRRKLLDEHGVSHATVSSGVDDGLLVRGGVTPAEWVASLAYFKAAAGRERLDRTGHQPGDVVVLGADTVVRKGDRVIGQPADGADAERILRVLQNGSHEVLTGVAFVDLATGQRDMWVDRARVRVGDLGDDRIGGYVGSGLWRGKAGAYNLSERLADGWPIEFEGDPGTIMGLPMRRLVDRLIAFRDACAG
jgi:septum formation protein